MNMNNIEYLEPVRAFVARDPDRIHRIFCQRAKYKHWFELGRYADTDVAFERALAAGSIAWEPAIEDKMQIFRKIY